MSNNIADVVLIGAGPMAIEYAKVMDAMQVSFITVGRGLNSAEKFKNTTGHNVYTGGLIKFLNSTKDLPDSAIIATSVETLSEVSRLLMENNFKNILCEKPGSLFYDQLKSLQRIVEEKQLNLLIAYNRRFYSSSLKAKEIIASDGGIDSFNFEFTEWSEKIAPLLKGQGVKEKWFLSNSTHVADLAFYLGGKPQKITCFTKNSLPWHSASATFAGVGISETNALFNYQANWNAPGRWGLEVLTCNNRIIFRPLEQLFTQKRGSVEIVQVELEDSLDKLFKPGLYRMVDNFLNSRFNEFCDLKYQLEMFPIYNQIANYTN
jgi:predicted dehydrogenase